MHAAGTDPAYVPGLLPPRPAEGAAEETPEEAVETPPEDTAPEGAAVAVPADLTVDEDDEEAVDDPAAAEEDVEDDLPVFEVADRRASITADRVGITFKLDGEVAEFGWDEVGAVEMDSPRFSRRFSVTVYTTSRRWYQADVEAPSRGAVKEWTAQLDAVLDARFEDAPEEPEEPEKAAGAEEGAEAAEPDEPDEAEAVAEPEAEKASAPEEADETEAEKTDTDAATDAKTDADAKD
jgi:hypothetical protein